MFSKIRESFVKDSFLSVPEIKRGDPVVLKLQCTSESPRGLVKH